MTTTRVKLGLAVACAGLMLAGPAWAQDVPEGYPDDYAQIIQAAQQENGLLVYSNVSALNWSSFLEFANSKYPWLRIETTDDSNMWEKYYAEQSSGVRTADMVLASHPDQWLEFIARGQVDPYVTPEIDILPDWSMPAPGVYSAAADPYIMAHARAYFPDGDAPWSMRDTVEVIQNRPDLAGKVTVMDPIGNLAGYAIWKAWLEVTPDGWELLEAIGPDIRPERSAGTVREKLYTGEYAIAVYSSGGGIPRYEEPEGRLLTEWGFATDGTPVLTRNVAITQAASSPNSARLLLDLILSKEGQIAFAAGGLTPYRDDISPDEVPYTTFSEIVERVGEDNVLFISPDPSILEGMEDFQARWNAALGN